VTEGESWLELSLVPGLGGHTARELLNELGSGRRILRAPERELKKVAGVGPRLAAAIREGPEGQRFEDELRAVERAGSRILGLGEQDYPGLLREIPDPPPVLYLLGRPLEADVPRVAIVGTRAPTTGGIATARRLAGDLSSAGVEVVSGLARGIDSAAHTGALEARGTTVAVLGCGIDVLYPMRRRDLRDWIAKQGTLVSEFPMRATPIPEYFPRRNRIISGLSAGVVVVEAGPGSGALLTADLALDQGRDVFAVPGSPTSRVSFGPNRLIQEGAKLVMSAADVLDELPEGARGEHLDGVEAREAPPGPVEQAILDALRSGAGLVDEVADKARADVPVVLERLLSMELRGLVRRVSGARYEEAVPGPDGWDPARRP